MDCDITAAKIIHFITPTLAIDASYDYINQECIWMLLKSSFDKADLRLVTQFERQPTLHHLRMAVTDLIAIQLKKDPLLLEQLNHYLNTYYDIEAVEFIGGQMTDLFDKARAISYAKIVYPLRKMRKLLSV